MSDPAWTAAHPEDAETTTLPRFQPTKRAESESDSSLGSKYGTDHDQRTWRYSTAIEDEYTVMSHEERVMDIHCHHNHIAKSCLMIQYQRDRAWAMNQIAQYELNQFQMLLYRFAEVPEYERHNAPDIGTQAVVGLLDCD
jgi:hypothetical protein